MTHARQPAPGRRPGAPGHAALKLQQAVGNRALGRTLARKATAAGSTVRIGKSTIAVSGGNVAEWAANEVPETLEVASEKGRHSPELERLSKERTRIPSLTLTVPLGNATEGQHLDMGSLSIEITNARIKGYALDGKAETWSVVGFDGVHRTKTSRKVGV